MDGQEAKVWFFDELAENFIRGIDLSRERDRVGVTTFNVETRRLYPVLGRTVRLYRTRPNLSGFNVWMRSRDTEDELEEFYRQIERADIVGMEGE